MHFSTQRGLSQCAATNIIEMEDQIKLAYILEGSIERFDKDLAATQNELDAESVTKY